MTSRTSRTPRSRRRTFFGRAGVVLLALVAVASTTALLRSGPDVGHWRSAAALAEYQRAHEELIAELPAAPEQLDVSTTFGTVRVLHWPAPDPNPGDPALLIPGRASGSAQWVENLPGWIGTREIYALDALGDAGFSAQRVPLEGVEKQADAYAEVLDALSIGKVHVVGHSFGGAQAANLATRHPERVRSLALLEPVLVIERFPFSLYFWATLISLPVPDSWRDAGLARIGGATPEEVREGGAMTRLIDAAARGYSASLPTPGALSDEQWRSISAPLRLDLGGRQSLSGAGAADRIRELLPDAHVTVWPEGTHSLPMDQREDFDVLIPQFWVAAESADPPTSAVPRG